MFSPVARSLFVVAASAVVFWPSIGSGQCPQVCAPPQFTVTGRVVDANGNPVSKVDLDFFLQGFKFPTTCDNTDLSGNYSVCLLIPGSYRITYEPLYPTNTHLVGKETLNVDLRTSKILPDIVLGFGQAIAGRATDTLGNPVDSVNLNVDDLIARKRLFTPGDKTDTLGNYRVVIPYGTYRFRYAPAPGRRQLGVQLDTVRISGRDTVIDVTIHGGFFVSGTILDTTFNSPGTPIAGVDLDMEDTLGNKVFLPRNTSDSLGKLTVVAPAGVFDFLFVPPRDSHFVAKKVRRFGLSSDTAITQALNRGVLLTVRVNDSLGNAVPAADLDVIRLFPSRNELFTPTDNADQFGVIKVAVPPDSYEIVINPPTGSTNFSADTLPGPVKILNDTTIDVILPGVPFRSPVAAESLILDARPNPFRPGGGGKILFPVDLASSAGNWNASLTIFSTSGEIVFRDKKQLSGGSPQSLDWNAVNENGETIASGIYFCHIVMEEAGGSKRIERALKVAVIR